MTSRDLVVLWLPNCAPVLRQVASWSRMRISPCQGSGSRLIQEALKDLCFRLNVMLRRQSWTSGALSCPVETWTKTCSPYPGLTLTHESFLLLGLCDAHRRTPSDRSPELGSSALAPHCWQRPPRASGAAWATMATGARREVAPAQYIYQISPKRVDKEREEKLRAPEIGIYHRTLTWTYRNP